MVQAGELRERMAVWKAGPVTTPSGETDYEYSQLRTIWAHVMPTSGRTAELPGEAERAEVTHKVTIRAGSLPEICREMYFVVRGQRLDVRGSGARGGDPQGDHPRRLAAGNLPRDVFCGARTEA